MLLTVHLSGGRHRSTPQMSETALSFHEVEVSEVTTFRNQGTRQCVDGSCKVRAVQREIAGPGH